MPTIKDFGAFKIYIFFKDENPPHFHVVAADFAAKVRIDDLSVIAGRLPSNVLRRVHKWADANRKTLEESWKRYCGT